MHRLYYLSQDEQVLYCETSEGFQVYYKMTDVLNNTFYECAYFDYKGIRFKALKDELKGPFELK